MRARTGRPAATHCLRRPTATARLQGATGYPIQLPVYGLPVGSQPKFTLFQEYFNYPILDNLPKLSRLPAQPPLFAIWFVPADKRGIRLTSHRSMARVVSH